MKKVQLHFVCGKGGVGKTTVSCALAQRFRDEGLSVLHVTVNAERWHPLAVNVTPQESLKEYLQLKIGPAWVLLSWLKFVPALAELNMLGKIWYHAQQLGAYDRIVVDCPSTGHGYQFLAVAQVAADGIKHGPIADEAYAMAATLADPDRSCVHIVTLPEELPVNEAIELAGRFRASQIVPLGSLIVNAVFDPIFTEDPKCPDTDWGIVAQDRYSAECEQQHQISRLDEANLGMPMERWRHDLG